MLYSHVMTTQIGLLTLEEADGALRRVSFGDCARGERIKTPLLARAQREIKEYLAGERRYFDLPLKLEGTPFQQLVWQALRDIPYGETRSYGELAAAIGRPKACRAVGMANHNNPLAIIVPCHRVIGANGRLTGYAGGLEIKRALLKLEGIVTE